MRQRVCDTRSLCRSVNRVPILPLLAVGVDGFSVGLAGETSVVTSVVQQEEAGSATGCPVDRLMMDADQALRDENSLEPLHASHRVYLLPVDFGTSCAFTALANTACAGAGCVAFLRDVRPKGCRRQPPLCHLLTRRSCRLQARSSSMMLAAQIWAVEAASQVAEPSQPDDRFEPQTTSCRLKVAGAPPLPGRDTPACAFPVAAGGEPAAFSGRDVGPLLDALLSLMSDPALSNLLSVVVRALLTRLATLPRMASERLAESLVLVPDPLAFAAANAYRHCAGEVAKPLRQSLLPRPP